MFPAGVPRPDSNRGSLPASAHTSANGAAPRDPGAPQPVPLQAPHAPTALPLRYMTGSPAPPDVFELSPRPVSTAAVVAAHTQQAVAAAQQAAPPAALMIYQSELAASELEPVADATGDGLL